MLENVVSVKLQYNVPKHGPPTTAMAYPASARALQAGLNKSPSTPPVLVTGALAKKAPKKRVSISVWKSFAVALPKLKHIATNMGASTASFLPKTSDKGAHRSGPAPKPKRNSVVPSTATWSPTWNSAATCRVPALYADDAHVAVMVVSPYIIVVSTFFFVGQFIGRYGSSGPSKSTSTSAAVCWWASGCVNGCVFVLVRNLDKAVSRLDSDFDIGAPIPVAVAMGCWRGREKLARLRDLEMLSVSSRLDGRWPSWSFSSSSKSESDELELDPALLLVRGFRSGSIASSSATGEARGPCTSEAAELASVVLGILRLIHSLVICSSIDDR